MDSIKEKTASDLLMTLSYDEMNEEQINLVVEYETERFKKRVDELRNEMPQKEIEETIHDWWLDYEIADGTEDNLLAYI